MRWPCAFRYESIEQERKFCNAINKAEEAHKASDRLDFLEGEAQSLGFDRVKNRNDQRIGIGMVMPKSTELVEAIFGDQAQYRILSGMAHSLPYATVKLANQSMSPGAEASVQKTDYHAGLTLLEPHLTTQSIFLLSYWSMSAMGKAVWAHCRLFGFDEQGMLAIFDDTIGKFLKPGRRFWRPTI